MPAYITFDEAKDWLKLTDSADDIFLAGLIEAATSQVIDVMQQDIALQETTERLRGLGTPLLMPRRDFLVEAISASWGGRDIEVEAEDGMIRAVRESFPRGVTVTVTYRAGLDPIPAQVKTAVKMQTAALFTAPAFDQNLAGENLGGVLAASYAPQGPGGVSVAVRALLNQYTRKFVVA